MTPSRGNEKSAFVPDISGREALLPRFHPSSPHIPSVADRSPVGLSLGLYGAHPTSLGGGLRIARRPGLHPPGLANGTCVRLCPRRREDRIVTAANPRRRRLSARRR